MSLIKLDLDYNYLNKLFEKNENIIEKIRLREDILLKIYEYCKKIGLNYKEEYIAEKHYYNNNYNKRKFDFHTDDDEYGKVCTFIFYNLQTSDKGGNLIIRRKKGFCKYDIEKIDVWKERDKLLYIENKLEHQGEKVDDNNFIREFLVIFIKLV